MEKCQIGSEKNSTVLQLASMYHQRTFAFKIECAFNVQIDLLLHKDLWYLTRPLVGENLYAVAFYLFLEHTREHLKKPPPVGRRG